MHHVHTAMTYWSHCEGCDLVSTVSSENVGTFLVDLTITLSESLSQQAARIKKRAIVRDPSSLSLRGVGCKPNNWHTYSVFGPSMADMGSNTNNFHSHLTGSTALKFGGNRLLKMKIPLTSPNQITLPLHGDS